MKQKTKNSRASQRYTHRKEKMFSIMCHMTRDGYKSNTKVKKKWPVAKMTKALNEANLATLVTTRHV